MDEFITFAKDLARRVGGIIKDNFEANLDVELKPDHSPVTGVDKQINKLVIDEIKKAFPEHGVLGEEASSSTGNEQYKWLCDPLDGTMAFIVGMKHVTFILGLLKDDEMVLAVVCDPFEDKLYYAVKGGGAFCNEKPIHVSLQGLKDGYVLFEQSAFGVYEKLVKAGAITEPVAGAGYRAMLLATGRCAAVVQGKSDHHDVGPSSLIVEEAGGKVTNFKGEKVDFSQPVGPGLILSNGTCHQAVVDSLNS